MSNKLKNAVLATLGVAVLAGAPFQAMAAATTLTLNGAAGTGTLSPQGWNGSNNNGSGWAHNSNWYSLQVPVSGNVNIKVTGTVSGAQPAFTVWTSGPTNIGASVPSSHSYNQVGDTDWLSASFVGFANNGLNSSFGSGPSDVSGQPATLGATSQIGTDGSGNHFAELIFSNVTPNTFYTIAVGGSGGGGGYQITASASAVPLPAAAWLLGSGLAGLGVLGRKKKV